MRPRAFVGRALQTVARFLRRRPRPDDRDGATDNGLDAPVPDPWLAGLRLRG